MLGLTWNSKTLHRHKVEQPEHELQCLHVHAYNCFILALMRTKGSSLSMSSSICMPRLQLFDAGLLKHTV